MAESPERLDVLVVDGCCIGHVAHDALDARFPQNAENRIGRAVAAILDRVGLAIGELIVRMEAGDLQRRRGRVSRALRLRVRETSCTG